MEEKKQNVNYVEKACLTIAFLLPLALGFSTALKSICVVSLILFSAYFLFLSKAFRSLATKEIKSNFFIWSCLGIVLMAFVGCFYSIASIKIMLRYLLKYCMYAAPCILIPLFFFYPKIRNAFFCGLKALLICLFLYAILYNYNMLFGLKAHLKEFFVNPILSSTFAATITIVFLHKFLKHKSIHNLIFFLLGVIYVFLLNPEKTGQFVVLVVSSFIGFYNFVFLRKKILAIYLMAFIGGFFMLSIKVSPKNRFKYAINTISSTMAKSRQGAVNVAEIKYNVYARYYHKTEDKQLVTELIEKYGNSIGIRMFWIKKGKDFFLQSPLWGHGTGSWLELMSDPNDKTKTTFLDNPHNGFIKFSTEWGAIGVCLFFAVCLAPFFEARRRKLNGFHVELLLFVGFCIAAASTSECMLTMGNTRDFFLFLISAVVADGIVAQKGKIGKQALLEDSISENKK